MTPIDYYKAQCEKGVISFDSNQLAVLHRLQTVHTQLLIEHKKRFGWLRLFHFPQLVKGVYVWGGIGIGKTWTMDCFYHSLPFKQKMRMHFHQFMQHIHEKLKQHQGEADPLQSIAAEIAKKTLLICFDEFVVSDIADAMLLGRLLKALFEKKVCFVATSNIMPDDLYKNQLQRLQFLPAIALIKEHTTVLHFASQNDYRLRHLKEAGVFYTPLNKLSEEKMEKTFALLSEEQPVSYGSLFINGRSIPIKKQANNMVWFDFKDICMVPRSQQDYLAIAEKYHTVFISDIPVIPESARDTICLFVGLVDVFYDAKLKLVISAAEPVLELYRRGFMVLEYERTHSRLIEMQSSAYFMGEES